MYNKHFLQTKIKSYHADVMDFHDQEILKEGSIYACLAVISIVCS